MTEEEKLAIIDMELELSRHGNFRVTSWADGSYFTVQFWPAGVGKFTQTQGSSLHDAVSECYKKFRQAREVKDANTI